MPIASQTVAGPIKTVRYVESPLMSTYLVAIVVGLLEYIEGVTPEGINSLFLCYFDMYHLLLRNIRGEPLLDKYINNKIKNMNMHKSWYQLLFSPLRSIFLILFINCIKAQKFVCTLKLARVTKGSLHWMLESSHCIFIKSTIDHTLASKQTCRIITKVYE
jgi:hypothetical protein